MTKKDSGKNTVLIVGDWVLDEYWFLVRHHSDISSHTGFVHYRIASTEGEPVADLCGAGHVARVLFGLRNKGKNHFAIAGIGNWNERDTTIIKHLIHAREAKGCSATKASFCLNPPCCSKPPSISLSSLNSDGPTIRVIRQYHQEGEGLEQISRVDWEPLRPQSNHEARNHLHRDRIKLPPPNQVKSVVIHDLNKGTVTRDLISFVNAEYPSSKWFVRSKAINPNWIDIVKDKIDLILIGPEVAALHNPWESWMFKGKITAQALELMKKLPGKNVALLSNRREVILRNTSSGMCITGRSPLPATPLTQLNWPSSFFASLIYNILQTSNNIDQNAVSSSLNLADCYGGVCPPNNGEPHQRFEHKAEVTFSSWEEEDFKWEQARSECGIIKYGKDFRLEVWRGQTHFPGYVTCIKKKEEIITRIGRSLT